MPHQILLCCSFLARWLAAALTLSVVAFATPAAAVPSFAVQTGQNCTACHVGGYGPQLTPYGRAFKIGGYTSRTDKFNLPLSAQVVASFVATAKPQAAPPTPDFHANNNLALDQVSLFLAGGIGNHFGGFVQVTYGGVNRQISWDNLDLRAVTTVDVGGKSVVAGISLNNAPGVQDPWNTVPAWGFPYTSSALSPSPSTAPLFAGGLAQNTLGLTAYAWVDSKIYIEAGGYKSPSAALLTSLGTDPYALGDINGVAPYARVAFQKQVGAGTLEIGALALRANLYPGRDHTTGVTDRYTDLGLDGSYQLPRANGDIFSVNARYIHETQNLRASLLLGNVGTATGDLDDIRIDASYYWRNAIGATVGVFDTTGSTDFIRYGGRTGRPDSNGVTFQLDGTPFGNGSPVGSRFNARIGVQYTAYGKFNGARTNFDGAGTNASDNNTLRIFTWLAF